MATGQNAAALNLTVQVAKRFSGSLASDTPAFISAYGILLLKGSIAAARSGHASVVVELQDEAGAVAEHAGEGNQLWSAFGPTNVAIHRVSAAADMHTAGNVLEAASQIDSTALERLPHERRAHHLLDLARGYTQWDKKDEAINALLSAEILAPQEIRCRPSTRKLIIMLLRSYRRGIKPPASLKRLAASIGVQT